MNKIKLKQIAVSISDGEHGSICDEPSNFLYLSSKNIVNNALIISDKERTISKADFIKINNRLKLRNNTILISTVGEIGKTAIIRENNPNYVFQRSVAAININESKANPYYVFLYLQTNAIKKYINFKTSGSVQKGLFLDDLYNLDLILPCIKRQQHIVDIKGGLIL